MRQIHFGTIGSYDDLNLFLPDGGMENHPPEPKRILANVPGADGQLDLSFGLGGDTKYNNRTITLKFVMADYEYQWDEIFSEILVLLHGKRFHVLIDPEQDYYWDAFCSVDSTSSDRNKGTVVVQLDCAPYKYKDITLSTTATSAGVTVTANVTHKTVVPAVTCVTDITITYNGDTFSFSAGTHKDLAFRLPAGSNSLVVKGSGSVTIAYSDGSL